MSFSLDKCHVFFKKSMGKEEKLCDMFKLLILWSLLAKFRKTCDIFSIFFYLRMYAKL